MSNNSIITGEAVRGHGQGRTLGFPTANLDYLQGTLPEPGIYACWAQLTPERSWYQAVIHIGPRPAIHDPKPVFEIHLLGFPDRDLYGSFITCKNLTFLRGIKNFASLDELKSAIAADCEQARTILQNSSQPDSN